MSPRHLHHLLSQRRAWRSVTRRLRDVGATGRKIIETEGRRR